MSDLPPNVPGKSEPLEYRGPEARQSRGWFIAAQVFAAMAILYCIVVFLMLLDGTPMYAMFLGGAAIAIVVATIVAGRLGVSAAMAIFVASLCIGILTFGTCAAAVLGSIGR